jgi:hypothetical protein
VTASDSSLYFSRLSQPHSSQVGGNEANAASTWQQPINPAASPSDSLNSLTHSNPALLQQPGVALNGMALLAIGAASAGGGPVVTHRPQADQPGSPQIVY